MANLRRAALPNPAPAAAASTGLTLIDTAEMYGDGGAEEVLARALRGLPRQSVLAASLSAENAGGIRCAGLRKQLRRLATDRIDLYLCIGAGRVRKATIDGMAALAARGKNPLLGRQQF